MSKLLHHVYGRRKATKIHVISRAEGIGSGEKGSDQTSRLGEDPSREALPGRVERPYTATMLYTSMGPLITCMKLSGLCFARTPSTKRKRTLDFWFYYSVFVTAVVGANFVRSLTAFSPGERYGSILFGKVQWSLWCFECSGKSVIFLHSFYQRDRIPDVFLRWQEADLSACPRFLVLAGVFVSSLFVLLNVFAISTAHLVSPDLEHLLCSVIWPPFSCESASIAAKFVAMFPLIYNTLVSYVSVTFYAVACALVVQKFKKLSASLARCVTADQQLKGSLEVFRLRHQCLCAVVEAMDKTFAPLLSLVFLCNIPMFCVVFYNLIHISTHPYETTVFLFWLIALIFHLGVVSLMTAWVNTAAHDLLPHLYKIRITEEMKSLEMEMMMFLSQLTGRVIGISASQLFTVTRETILTVIGMLITYVVLLIQFEDSAHRFLSCNCTQASSLSNSTPI